MSEVLLGAKRGPGETRRMVRDFYVQGKTRREIAALTGVSEQAVGKHLRRLFESGEIERRTP